MTDISVYFFMYPRGAERNDIRSKRRATLATIQGRGEAVMASRVVVDDSDLDDNGFLMDGASNLHPADALWPQIRSLESRARSREAEALTCNESIGTKRQFRLRREGRELRADAQSLRRQVERSFAGQGSATPVGHAKNFA